MRTTQHIGLTEDALKWLTHAIKTETYKMTTGMFGETVYGNIYHMPASTGPNRKLIAKEVVQHNLWSSGPMIFTHLEITLVKESGQKVSMGYYYSWVTSPMLNDEYDQRTGKIKG